MINKDETYQEWLDRTSQILIDEITLEGCDPDEHLTSYDHAQGEVNLG